MDNIEEDFLNTVTLKGTSSQFLFKQVTTLQKIRDNQWQLKLNVHTLFLEVIKVLMIFIIDIDDFRSKDVVEKHDQNWNVEVKKA